MPAGIEILLLWGAFALSHIGLSSDRLRPTLIAKLGERGFMGLYSLIALAIFVPLVGRYFGNKHSGPLLWSFGDTPGVHWFMYLGMALALSLLVAGIVRPSPASMSPGKAEVSGVLRVTRHPLFMAMGLYGLLHLLAAPVHASELAFFGGFPVFAIVGCRHQDQRKLASAGPDFRKFYDGTAFLPGARGGFGRFVREQPIAVAVGVGVTVLLRVYHANLFGG